MFQSTPAISGGRTNRCARHRRSTSSFNPRPPSLAGEPRAMVADSVQKDCFNPRPPSLAGEPACSRSAAQCSRVSIHARHLWRANLRMIGPGMPIRWFQSTPAISGGRTPVERSHARRPGSFNPRPPSLAGEPRGLAAWTLDYIVSIHARHLWRANRPRCSGLVLPEWVSIHARHLWRANLGRGFLDQRFKGVSIHARHLWRANPPSYGRRTKENGFQSTPAISGGRTVVIEVIALPN